MSGSVNKVILVGHLGRDPEVRQTQDGGKIVNLSLATSEVWKDRDSGERRDRTEWHRVVVFNDRIADVAERFLKKGSKVYLEGQLQTRKWTDSATGQEKYTTEIVLSKYRGELAMLDGRGDGAGTSSSGAGNYGALSEDSAGSYASNFTHSPTSHSLVSHGNLDDEIPF